MFLYCDVINNVKKFKFNTFNLHYFKNRIRKNRIHTFYVLATIDGRFPSQKYGQSSGTTSRSN